MIPTHHTSGKRFIGPRVDPITGEPVFPLRRLPPIREGDVLSVCHWPDGRRVVEHPSVAAERDMERRVLASRLTA